MKRKREELSEKDETFNTSKVFSNFEDITLKTISLIQIV